ncbi:hypothetical protein HK102_005809, partial [Quaeritorhiza haematococci]
MDSTLDLSRLDAENGGETEGTVGSNQPRADKEVRKQQQLGDKSSNPSDPVFFPTPQPSTQPQRQEQTDSTSTTLLRRTSSKRKRGVDYLSELDSDFWGRPQEVFDKIAFSVRVRGGETEGAAAGLESAASKDGIVSRKGGDLVQVVPFDYGSQFLERATSVPSLPRRQSVRIRRASSDAGTSVGRTVPQIQQMDKRRSVGTVLPQRPKSSFGFLSKPTMMFEFGGLGKKKRPKNTDVGSGSGESQQPQQPQQKSKSPRPKSSPPAPKPTPSASRPRSLPAALKSGQSSPAATTKTPATTTSSAPKTRTKESTRKQSKVSNAKQDPPSSKHKSASNKDVVSGLRNRTVSRQALSWPAPATPGSKRSIIAGGVPVAASKGSSSSSSPLRKAPPSCSPQPAGQSERKKQPPRSDSDGSQSTMTLPPRTYSFAFAFSDAESVDRGAIKPVSQSATPTTTPLKSDPSSTNITTLSPQSKSPVSPEFKTPTTHTPTIRPTSSPPAITTGTTSPPRTASSSVLPSPPSSPSLPPQDLPHTIKREPSSPVLSRRITDMFSKSINLAGNLALVGNRRRSVGVGKSVNDGYLSDESVDRQSIFSQKSKKRSLSLYKDHGDAFDDDKQSARSSHSNQSVEGKMKGKGKSTTASGTDNHTYPKPIAIARSASPSSSINDHASSSSKTAKLNTSSPEKESSLVKDAIIASVVATLAEPPSTSSQANNNTNTATATTQPPQSSERPFTPPTMAAIPHPTQSLPTPQQPRPALSPVRAPSPLRAPSTSSTYQQPPPPPVKLQRKLTAFSSAEATATKKLQSVQPSPGNSSWFSRLGTLVGGARGSDAGGDKDGAAQQRKFVIVREGEETKGKGQGSGDGTEAASGSTLGRFGKMLVIGGRRDAKAPPPPSSARGGAAPVRRDGGVERNGTLRRNVSRKWSVRHGRRDTRGVGVSDSPWDPRPAVPRGVRGHQQGAQGQGQAHMMPYYYPVAASGYHYQQGQPVWGVVAQTEAGGGVMDGKGGEAIQIAGTEGGSSEDKKQSTDEVVAVGTNNNSVSSSDGVEDTGEQKNIVVEGAEPSAATDVVVDVSPKGNAEGKEESSNDKKSTEDVPPHTEEIPPPSVDESTQPQPNLASTNADPPASPSSAPASTKSSAPSSPTTPQRDAQEEEEEGHAASSSLNRHDSGFTRSSSNASGGSLDISHPAPAPVQTADVISNVEASLSVAEPKSSDPSSTKSADSTTSLKANPVNASADDTSDDTSNANITTNTTNITRSRSPSVASAFSFTPSVSSRQGTAQNGSEPAKSGCGSVGKDLEQSKRTGSIRPRRPLPPVPSRAATTPGPLKPATPSNTSNPSNKKSFLARIPVPSTVLPSRKSYPAPANTESAPRIPKSRQSSPPSLPHTSTPSRTLSLAQQPAHTSNTPRLSRQLSTASSSRSSVLSSGTTVSRSTTTTSTTAASRSTTMTRPPKVKTGPRPPPPPAKDRYPSSRVPFNEKPPQQRTSVSGSLRTTNKTSQLTPSPSISRAGKTSSACRGVYPARTVSSLPSVQPARSNSRVGGGGSEKRLPPLPILPVPSSTTTTSSSGASSSSLVNKTSSSATAAPRVPSAQDKPHAGPVTRTVKTYRLPAG